MEENPSDATYWPMRGEARRGKVEVPWSKIGSSMEGETMCFFDLYGGRDPDPARRIKLPTLRLKPYLTWDPL